MSFTKYGVRLFAVVISFGSLVAVADPVGGTGGSWQSGWSKSSLVTDSSSPTIGNPYWNNVSGDGPKSNIGWCLAGGGACSLPGGSPGVLPYYGNGTGSVSTMYLTSTGGTVDVSLLGILTTQTTTAGGYDVFGYYVAGADGKAGGVSSLTPVFDSRMSGVGTTVMLSGLAVNQKYGFYIENIQGGGTRFESDYFYMMDSTSDLATGSMPADTLQHFAVFQGSSSYFIGDADGDACQGAFQPGTSPCVPASQFDFNNILVQVSTAATSTPEPATFVLFGAGLVLAGARVRRNKTSEK